MSTSVQVILEAAYNRYAGNDPGKLAQDPELIVHLDRVYQRTWPLLARARPDEFQSNLAATLLGVPPQVVLPANTIDVVSAWNAAGADVYLIPSKDRRRSWQLAPSVYRQGLTLYSRAAAGDPLAGDVLTLAVLDAPAALTTLGSVLDVRWPVRHVQLFVDALATYLAVKDDGRSVADRQALASELMVSVAAMASEYALPPEAVQWIHGDLERSTK